MTESVKEDKKAKKKKTEKPKIEKSEINPAFFETVTPQLSAFIGALFAFSRYSDKYIEIKIESAPLKAFIDPKLLITPTDLIRITDARIRQTLYTYIGGSSLLRITGISNALLPRYVLYGYYAQKSCVPSTIFEKQTKYKSELKTILTIYGNQHYPNLEERAATDAEISMILAPEEIDIVTGDIKKEGKVEY